MSKIGRKPIVTDGVTVQIKGQEVTYKGPKGSGHHVLPLPLCAELDGNALLIKVNKDISISPKEARDVNRVWGLHHALLENKIHGAVKEFERKLKIIGLGYKAALSGKLLTLSLGYSHKIDFEIPEGVSVVIDDKQGQNLTVKSSDPVLAGGVASKIRFFRKPEPYKGRGIRRLNEIVRLKAGKTKAG
jgi:large subunit ribosomal protein L6